MNTPFESPPKTQFIDCNLVRYLPWLFSDAHLILNVPTKGGWRLKEERKKDEEKEGRLLRQSANLVIDFRPNEKPTWAHSCFYVRCTKRNKILFFALSQPVNVKMMNTELLSALKIVMWCELWVETDPVAGVTQCFWDLPHQKHTTHTHKDLLKSVAFNSVKYWTFDKIR